MDLAIYEAVGSTDFVGRSHTVFAVSAKVYVVEGTHRWPSWCNIQALDSCQYKLGIRFDCYPRLGTAGSAAVNRTRPFSDNMDYTGVEGATC